MKKSNIVLLFAVGAMLIGCGPKKPSGGGDNEYNVPTYEETSVQIHYKRTDNAYDTWALWLWKYPDGTGEEWQFNGNDAFGTVASYPLSNWTNCEDDGLGFIIKSKGSWSQKDVDSDRVIDFTALEKDDKDVYHVYLKNGDSNVYVSEDLKILDSITMAAITGEHNIAINTATKASHVKIFEDEEIIYDQSWESGMSIIRPRITDRTLSFEKVYKAEVTFLESQKTMEVILDVSGLYDTDSFKSNYIYDGELGAIYTKESTTFKVWSPISKSVKLRIYSSGTPKSVDATKGDDTFVEYNMTKGEKGVFTTTVTGDLEGKYYTFVVTNSSYTDKETVDPYAYSTGVNGARGMIVDFTKTNPEGWNDIDVLPYDRKELTVYETHVADITSSSTWTSDAATRKFEKTFKGATITGTTYTEGGVTVKTGFDHIKELGVNAVQLIPIFDQANDETNMTFNWGYNPSNYNALEGGYSTDPYDGYARIKEFKELVLAYNEAGMNIIMDVVYNHMNGATGSNFDILMPGYYFRYTSAGKLSNGSGCGNETASNREMFRKFMIDSTSFWAKEYKLGGFRFDLMGLHDLETMKQLTAKLNEIDSHITVYGEPWNGGTSTLADIDSAKQVNLKNYEGYGAFNDKMRDALIKGGLNAVTDKGWITSTSAPQAGDLSAIASGIKGATRLATGEVNDPDKTVNYVTCHDNYTLYDRIKAAGITDETTIKKMAMLANSVVLTSGGTSFMLAGEEFLRTKGGDSNSYSSSYKVNELDYSLKIKNKDMFDNYKFLINFKQTISGLHLDGSQNSVISVDVSKKNLIKYTITDSTTGKEYLIIHCNGYSEATLGTLDLSDYELEFDSLGYTELSAATPLHSYETLIVSK
ncbi:MAG: type I pullulanase [Bacilli bacterium]|nr:type I pullulanase [Bacilli bacterium]